MRKCHKKLELRHSSKQQVAANIMAWLSSLSRWLCDFALERDLTKTIAFKVKEAGIVAIH